MGGWGVGGGGGRRGEREVVFEGRREGLEKGGELPRGHRGGDPKRVGI